MKWRGVSDRLVFPEGEQRVFMLMAKTHLKMEWSQIADAIDVNARSVRDWARERFNISQSAALRLSEISGVKIPVNTKVKVWNDHLRLIGKKGNESILKQYGGDARSLVDEEYRKEKWKEWWNKKGKYVSSIKNQPLDFHAPKLSSELAEFVGIMLGDGGVSKYQLTVTLHRHDDREYGEFVNALIKNLFHVDTSIVRNKHALADSIVVSRVKMVEYAVNQLGLSIGNKVRQQVDIPDWIKKESSYSIACIRGLFDTDGSVFTHRYKVKGKEYRYKKLSFTNFSSPLLLSFYDVLTSVGIHCRLASDHDIRIDSQKDVARYFKIIGSHNPKHLKRYQA